MTRGAFAGLLVLVLSAPTWAQQDSDRSLSDSLHRGQVLRGQALFVQSCSVCHSKVQQTSVRFGPALSKSSLGGQDDVMREVISNGTPRMPGFKHHFGRDEIDAIVAYLKTVPAQ